MYDNGLYLGKTATAFINKRNIGFSDQKEIEDTF